jgi:hypothetical protein
VRMRVRAKQIIVAYRCEVVAHAGVTVTRLRPSQCRGREFDPPAVHHFIPTPPHVEFTLKDGGAHGFAVELGCSLNNRHPARHNAGTLALELPDY